MIRMFKNKTDFLFLINSLSDKKKELLNIKAPFSVLRSIP